MDKKDELIDNDALNRGLAQKVVSPEGLYTPGHFEDALIHLKELHRQGEIKETPLEYILFAIENMMADRLKARGYELTNEEMHYLAERQSLGWEMNPLDAACWNAMLNIEELRSVIAFSQDLDAASRIIYRELIMDTMSLMMTLVRANMADDFIKGLAAIESRKTNGATGGKASKKREGIISIVALALRGMLDYDPNIFEGKKDMQVARGVWNWIVKIMDLGSGPKICNGMVLEYKPEGTEDGEIKKERLIQYPKHGLPKEITLDRRFKNIVINKLSEIRAEQN